jgi:hypothetical protein
VVWLVEDAARWVRPDEVARTARVAAVAGLACVPLWRDLALWAMHLDDVLALLFTAAAVNAVARGRAGWAGLAIALAIGSKPWAVPFVFLLLALPQARSRVRAAATMAVGVIAVWGPFLAVPGTFTALAQLRILVYQTSALTLVGVVVNEPAPGWIRPAQLLIGVALAGVYVVRGRWAAVPLVGIAVRISLDAGVWNYYFAGLVVGALIWDLIGSRFRFPWWTVLCLAAEYDVRWLLNSSAASAWLSLAPALVAALVALVPSVRGHGWVSWPAGVCLPR